MGTDVGGGTTLPYSRQLNEAYKVAMLQMKNLDAVKVSTSPPGGAEALHLENTIGSIAPGYEADIAVLDLKPSEFATWRLKFSNTILRNCLCS